MTGRRGPPVDRAAFERLRRIAPTHLRAWREQAATATATSPMPDEVSFKLTNRCDLRCTHCYQWGEGGHHWALSSSERCDDLELEVVARVLEATRSVASNLYFWGGEPLIYRHWDGLVELLARDPRWMSICTNGTNLARRLDSLEPFSDRVELVVSVDGFEAQHDRQRGAGAFERTFAGLRALTQRRERGAWRGSVAVNCVISEELIPLLTSFVEFLEAEALDAVYVSFPWYLSPGAAREMDAYVTANLPDLMPAAQPSWHSYGHHLKPEVFDQLTLALAQLAEHPRRLRLRFNPPLDDGERADFLLGSGKPALGKTRCQALHSRMDVLPSGDVVSCKFFPEFVVGNLREQPVADAWRSARYEQVRTTVATKGLMPGCAKCPLLYTRGA